MNGIAQGTRVRALWDFTATSENEISLEEDDVITLTGVVDGGWWEGDLNGIVGFFPANYVEVVQSDDAYDYSSARKTMLLMQEQIGLSDTKDKGISAERNRTWYISYKQQDEGVAKDDAASDKSSSPAPQRLVASPPKPAMPDLPRPKKWTDGVDGLLISRLSDKEKKRQEVIFEMIETERDYLRDLDMIVENYLNPIRTKKMLTAKDTMVIFSIIEMLMPVNQELLRNLEERRAQHPIIYQVGDILMHVADYLKIYNMYCSNHPFALMKLESLQGKQFRTFINEVRMRPESRGLDLGSYLIKPVQRICKYPLLVREIKKQTEPNHPDFHDLEEALQKINMVVTVVNEATRHAEMVHKMLQLQSRLSDKMNLVTPARQLIRDETIAMIKNGKRKEKRRYILFNDMLLLTKPAKISADKLLVVATMPLDLVTISNVDDTSFAVGLPDQEPRCVVAPDAAAKTLWMQELEQFHEDEAAHKAQEREYALADSEMLESSASELSTAAESASRTADEKAQRKAEEKAQRAREKAERKLEKDRLKAEDKARREQEAADKARLAEEERQRKQEAKDMARASRSQSTVTNPPGRNSLDSPRPSSPASAPNSPKPTGRDRATSGGPVERSVTIGSGRQGSPTPGRQSPSAGSDAEFNKVILRRVNSEGGATAGSPRNQPSKIGSTSSESSEPSSPSSRPESFFASLWARMFRRNTTADDANGDMSAAGASNAALAVNKDLPPLPRKSYVGRPVPNAPQPYGQSRYAESSGAVPNSAAAALPTHAPRYRDGRTREGTPRTAPSSPQAATPASARPRASTTSADRPGSSAQLTGPVAYVTAATVRDHVRLDVNTSYAFVIEVQAEGGRSFAVSKSYDDFYAFHTALIKQFPEEAGLTGKRRTLPDLPAQAIHVTEAFAMQQQRDFDRYVKALFRMPEKVWHTSFVANFFRENVRNPVQAPRSSAPTRGPGDKPYTVNPAFQRTGVPAAVAGAAAAPGPAASPGSFARPALRSTGSSIAGTSPSSSTGSPSAASRTAGASGQAATANSGRIGSPSAAPTPRPAGPAAVGVGGAGTARTSSFTGLDPDLQRTAGKVANSPFIAAAGGVSHTLRKPVAPQLPLRSAQEQQRQEQQRRR